MYTADNSIFDHFAVPPEIDRQLVIDNLLMETAELEILYPSPSFLKLAIQRWSQKELPIWQELYDTTTYVYNPIHNYDRTEDGWDDRVPNLTYGKGTGDHSTTRGTDTTTASQRAFNDGSGLVDVDKQIFDHGSGVDTTHDGADTETGNEKTTHHMEISGNIGVMSTQEMIQKQRDVVQFNVIDEIIRSFKDRFCLLIY